MTAFQKVMKYVALAFALLLIVAIVGGIVGGIAAIASVFDGGPDSDIKGDMTTQQLPTNIGIIDIELDATSLTVREGEAFTLQTNSQNLRIEQRTGYLEIDERRKLAHYPDGLELILTIPADMIFTSVEINTGAGHVDIDALTADNIDLDFGAGDVDIHNINARKVADIDGGAGKITIKSGLVRNLDLDMGVGELRLGCLLTGHSDLDLGVGSTYITLPVHPDNYTVRIDKGLGTVTLDGQKVGSGSYGNGGHTVSISGGVGSIDITFVQE